MLLSERRVDTTEILHHTEELINCFTMQILKESLRLQKYSEVAANDCRKAPGVILTFGLARQPTLSL